MKQQILCVAAAAAWILPASADVISINPSKDNTLYEYVPAEFEDPLSNGKGYHFFTGVALTGRKKRAVMQFDVAGAVPPGSTITGATLALNVSQTRAGDAPVSIHRLAADWGEGRAAAGSGAGAPADAGSATWFSRFFPGNPWVNPGGDFVTSASAVLMASSGGPCSVSGPGLAADVQVWLDEPASNFGWCLVGPEDEIGTAKRFDSVNNPEVSVRPTLTIVFTPPVACVGDYNEDGGVDGADVEAFFEDWENGLATADLNEDGGVDGADVEFFFAAWESGC